MKNSILDIENDVAEQIAQRTLAKREAGYASEVGRLLDAALEVMRQGGMAARPRVADIVAAAASQESSLREAMTTSAPASASVCTIARPMPRDPPVTTATLPVRS